jgi:hypothetical protein
MSASEPVTMITTNAKRMLFVSVLGPSRGGRLHGRDDAGLGVYHGIDIRDTTWKVICQIWEFVKIYSHKISILVSTSQKNLSAIFSRKFKSLQLTFQVVYVTRISSMIGRSESPYSTCCAGSSLPKSAQNAAGCSRATLLRYSTPPRDSSAARIMARASAVNLFGVPFCRPPVFLPCICCFYFRAPLTVPSP